MTTLHSKHSASRRRAAGATMIEVLVALVVTLFGLFALLGVNMRAYRAESESYQRSQALILVDDMAQRIKANRFNATSYALAAASAAGTGAIVACAQPSLAARDLCDWGNLLRGAAEVNSGGTAVGAVSDARGCVWPVTAPGAGASGPVTANITVVWRGVTPSAAAASAPCVPTGYSTSDGLLRYTSTIVRFGDLDG